MPWAKRIIIFSTVGFFNACAPTGYPVSYETLSSDEVENIRKVIHGPYQNHEWEKTNSLEPTGSGLNLGQEKNKFDALMKSRGFQRVGGISHGTPYSCVDDPCACSQSKTINYVRTVDPTKSFETIALRYGSRTFDGVCRSGLFDISSVDIYEKTKNAKN